MHIKVCLYQVQKATIARNGLKIEKEGRIKLERSNVSLSLLFVSHTNHGKNVLTVARMK